MEVEKLLLPNILPEMYRIQEAYETIGNSSAKLVHATVIDKNKKTLGSGTHKERRIAHLIAIHEAIERRIMTTLSCSPQASDFLLDKYPSSCGFAVHQDRFSAELISRAEAIERWLRSKWIDDGLKLKETSLAEENLDPIDNEIASRFDKIRVFKHATQAYDHPFKRLRPETYYSTIVVGIIKNGCYVGSKTGFQPRNLISHSLVEAWRHLQIHRNITKYPRTFSYEVIRFFGENANVALKQIARATSSKPFPIPGFQLCKEVMTGQKDLSCYRSLCRDFRGWHEEDLHRFVY